MPINKEGLRDLTERVAWLEKNQPTPEAQSLRNDVDKLNGLLASAGYDLPQFEGGFDNVCLGPREILAKSESGILAKRKSVRLTDYGWMPTIEAHWRLELLEIGEEDRLQELEAQEALLFNANSSPIAPDERPIGVTQVKLGDYLIDLGGQIRWDQDIHPQVQQTIAEFIDFIKSVKV